MELGYVEPTSRSLQTDAHKKKNDEMKLNDLKVKNYLFQAIDRTVLDTILKKDTAKEIWDAMKKSLKEMQGSRSLISKLSVDNLKILR